MAKTSQKQENNYHIGLRVGALILGFLTIMAYFKSGIIGEIFYNIFSFLFGDILLLVVFLLLLVGSLYTAIRGKLPPLASMECIGVYLVLIGGLMMSCYKSNQYGIDLITKYIKDKPNNQGGLIGKLFYGILSGLFDSTGALWFSIIILIVGLILISHKFILSSGDDTKVRLPKRNKPVVEEKVQKKPKKKVNRRYVVVDSDDEPKYKRKKTVMFDDSVFDIEDTYLEPEITDAFVKHTPESELVFNEEKMILDIEDHEEEIKEEVLEPVNGTPVSANYKLPPLKLLNKGKANKGSYEEMRNAKNTAVNLESLLQQFGVNVKVEDIKVGPTVTKYELKLEIGTRVNKILSLQDDIQLALAAKDIRIEAPIPGKPFVGIEVPNTISNSVSFHEVLQLALKDKTASNKLAVPLGKDISGQLIIAELDKMPHLLIAGATGSGKSVCINCIITSLLMKATPDEVKLLLVDPKKVELSDYNDVPHLLSPVVTDPRKAAGVLSQVVIEMERRYQVFADANKRNMTTYNTYAKSYNESHEDKKEVLPYIVVILDEVADLMMVASKSVEDSIMRLAQMARAAGIHMIVATQRPSTDIITGVIKANIPSRIAFAVSSSIDSRTILDSTGAEKLLGKGDMLFSPMGAPNAVRVQGALVTDEEVERVVSFVKNQQDVEYDDVYSEAKPISNDSSKSNDIDDNDEEYEECRMFVIEQQKASTSLLQRRFRIGYNKAARIMDQLEANGVIGPPSGSKPREVYIKTTEQEEDY